MLEKIVLAIAITLSLYLSSNSDIKPAPRFVGVEVETQLETISRFPVLMML